MPAAHRWQRRKDGAGIIAVTAVVALMLYLALAPARQPPTTEIRIATRPAAADEVRAVIRRPAVPVVFDTDTVNGIDDTLALAMLLGYQSRHEVKLLAVTSSYRDEAVAGYLDAIDSWFGAGETPVGVIQQGGVTAGRDAFHRQVAGAFPHDVGDDGAVAQLRRALAGQADRTVVVVSTGFATNLAQLLESAPDGASPLSGRELVKTKVKLLAMTAGDFLRARPEANTALDATSARLVFGTWPSPIVATEWQVGANLAFPGEAVTGIGPLEAAMRAYGENALGVPFPYNPPGTDPATVLYAVEPDRYLKVGEPGRISLDDQAVARFTPDPQGQHRLVLRPIDPGSREAVTRRFSELVQPPTR